MDRIIQKNLELILSSGQKGLAKATTGKTLGYLEAFGESPCIATEFYCTAWGEIMGFNDQDNSPYHRGVLKVAIEVDAEKQRANYRIIELLQLDPAAPVVARERIENTISEYNKTITSQKQAKQ